MDIKGKVLLPLFNKRKLRNETKTLLEPKAFCFSIYSRGMEAKAVKSFWKRKHFEERSWKRRQTRKHLTFWGPRSRSIFHKKWGKDVEAKAESG